MEYLTEKYWEIINTDKNDNKGICFEKLVQDLLIAEYGKTAFQSTRHSWDGNKDFFYYSKQKNFWAECKNYASNIDLKILASTLIMAQLSEIDTILFYSYSPININTKAKLLISAEKKGETIYFYDDIVLERKIFQYWEYIGERFFPEFPYRKEMYPTQSEHYYEAKCLLFGNPLDTACSIDGYELKHLTLFKMFEMNVCIINKENCTNTISLGFKKIEQINTQFEVYPEHIVKSKTTFSLAPYEGKIIRLWLIPIKENCIIPRPYINGKQVSLPKNVEFKSLKIKNRNGKRLIGQSYEQSVVDYKQKVLYETNELKIGIFYGHSGTGKSRLYQECLNISKINGYEIIDFCSMINTERAQSTQDFIQKILTILYDITLDELEQIIKALAFYGNDDQFLSKQPEYRMLADMFNTKNDADMRNWLNMYLNLIVLKLAKNKFVIAIDDLQFFNDTVLDLIDEICNRLLKIRPCNTKFLFIFNVDYIKRNSKADFFLGNYTSNYSACLTKHITGFENSKECFEFLQEMFSIGDIFQKNEINNIAENLNKNPFYLEQMIYWLQDKHVLEKSNNNFIIKNEFQLKSLIRNIPNSVYDILEKRWGYYIKHSSSNSKEVIVLFSAIHLYKELEKKDIDDLGISWNTLRELENIGFIILEDTFNAIIIKFRHDLVDKFFSKLSSSFSKTIIDFENQKNISIRNNKIRYYFGVLYSERNLSNKHLSDILTLHIDNRLSYEFYLLLFNKYLDSFNQNYMENKITWINNMYKIIIIIHDILGNTVMKKCVDRLLFMFRNNQDVFHYTEYGRLLLYISEAYDSMGKYQEAVQLIKEYKDKAFGIQDENVNTIEQKKLLSEIYNRLHVYSRHQVLTPIGNKKIMNYLNASVKIADDISYTVMQYVNYSDRGYLYYDLPLSDKNHVFTVVYWKEACKIYEKGGAEVKELNYLRKKVQLALLEGNFQKAVSAAEIGLEQIDFSEYSYQQTFFKWWFYHALAEGYLLSYSAENMVEIEKSLERAQFYSELLESNKIFYYLQLKSVYMYYSGNKSNAVTLNREAMDLVEASNYNKKKNSLKHQLQENESILLSVTPKPRKNLYSQIHTADGLFNLPCI